ncbi:MAG: translation elongation factor Ts [Spongiibacter sp.]|uniref:Elongation factor Ts n=1 Tax=Spongiibacter thalassae TaxID=2721624 RepID=A0ABX1GGT5_9GAMM|nr:translation elongation factor Ts [Spongiibacter thalassae]MDX1504937.1 translation elongation factor Ts [Spongiibacter sp.]NKI17592.1 elongation factor Ts [Spongiibacter thalassae]
MAVSASMVKELRDRTGLGMMECKKALNEANGDIELAIEELRKSSGMKAAKKAGRTAADGVVATKVAEDGSYGILVEVNSETDFVARDEGFLAFVQLVADKAFADKQTDVAALMSGDLETAREALVQKIGENISVRRIEVLAAESGVVDSYVHSNNRIAVLVALKGGDAELARDVAMHVAAVNPRVARGEDMPAEVIEKEREIFTAQAAESGKPAEIIEKMIEGRIRKFLSENALVDQAFVKDPELTVGKLLKNGGADIQTFIRYEVGEGIEKEEVDFAAEVAAQLKG